MVSQNFGVPNKNSVLNWIRLGDAANRNKSKEWRRQGDVAREERDWESAAKAYQRHLELMPGDQAIWVQLGHALKEGGQLLEALAAYKNAKTLAPDDLDLEIHLTHLRERIEGKSVAERDRIEGDRSPRDGLGGLQPDSEPWQRKGPVKSPGIGATAERLDIGLLAERLRR